MSGFFGKPLRSMAGISASFCITKMLKRNLFATVVYTRTVNVSGPTILSESERPINTH